MKLIIKIILGIQVCCLITATILLIVDSRFLSRFFYMLSTVLFIIYLLAGNAMLENKIKEIESQKERCVSTEEE